MVFTKAYELAHLIVAPFIEEGSLAVDATAGNGKDTLFLAQRVGPSGHVYAFDIQPQALDKTEDLLAGAGLRERVTLFEAGHEHLSDYIDRRIKAVMFNLGYLPGGDHAIITKPETTRSGLENALELLDNGGIISLVVYTGHPESLKEKDVLEKLCRDLDQRAFTVTHHAFINQVSRPPELITIQKH